MLTHKHILVQSEPCDGDRLNMNINYPILLTLALVVCIWLDDSTWVGFLLLKIGECGCEHMLPNKPNLQKPVYLNFQKIIKDIKLEWTWLELKLSLNWWIFISIAFGNSCYVITMFTAAAICQYRVISPPKVIWLEIKNVNDSFLWAPILEVIGQTVFYLGSSK